MGVRGLETFAERTPGVCFDVDLKELIALYIKEEKKKPVIVLDLLSVLSGSVRISSLAGGQTKEVVEKVTSFLKSLEDLGAEVVVFADGVIDPNKERTKIIRKNERVESFTDMFEKLKHNPMSFDKGYYKQSNISRFSFYLFLLNNNKNYIRTLIECDLEMVKYASENDCFAILAQDTDFLIYPGICHYLSMKHFNMVKMKTKEYSQKNLAQVLGLKVEHLPVLASLIGNDIIKSDELRNFHLRLSENRQRIDYSQLFKKVANFISYNFSLGKSYDETLAQICSQVFQMANYPKFGISLQTYDTKYPHKAFPMDETLGDGWFQVQELAKDLYIQGRLPSSVYNVILGVPLFSGPYIEDFIKKPFLPADVLTSKLRKRMYGILLQEKPLIDHAPHIVEENHISGFEIYRGPKEIPIIRHEPEHSGLVHLWTSHDDESYDEKMSLFHFCLGIGKEITGLEERHLIIPAASIKYLFAEGFKVLNWELTALVVSMVLVDFYSVERLKEIPEFPIDTRGINLYTVFCECCLTATKAMVSCGSPLRTEEYDPARYHDGKLFQLKYREAKSRMNFDQLCENNRKVITTSKKIIYILRKTG